MGSQTGNASAERSSLIVKLSKPQALQIFGKTSGLAGYNKPDLKADGRIERTWRIALWDNGRDTEGKILPLGFKRTAEAQKILEAKKTANTIVASDRATGAVKVVWIKGENEESPYVGELFLKMVSEEGYRISTLTIELTKVRAHALVGPQFLGEFVAKLSATTNE